MGRMQVEKKSVQEIRFSKRGSFRAIEWREWGMGNGAKGSGVDVQSSQVASKERVTA